MYNAESCLLFKKFKEKTHDAIMSLSELQKMKGSVTSTVPCITICHLGSPHFTILQPRNHSSVALTVCLGSLWRLTSATVSSLLQTETGFLQELPLFGFMSPPCFSVGNMLRVICNVGFSPHVAFCTTGPKASILFLWRGHDLALCLLCCPHGLWQTPNRISYGFLSSTAFLSPLSKARFEEYMPNSCPVDGFSHLNCGSFQLIQSNRRPLGCFSDQSQSVV